MLRRMRRLLVALVLLFSVAAFGQSDNPLLDRAMQGDAAAQLKLAKAYQYGDGQRKDMHEALRWYLSAAAKGSAESAYILGTLNYNGDVLGDNVDQSTISAWAWFRAAAEEGDPQAVEALQRTEAELSAVKLMQAHEFAAAMFLRGEKVPANAEAAAKELDWLVQHESRQGTLLLGLLYLDGKGIPKDLDKARTLCEKAESLRTPGANWCLSRIFDENNDPKAAFDALKRDAEMGYPQAMLAIVDRYHDGAGTKADAVQSLAWAIRAADNGVPQAAEKREAIAAELSDRQKKEAQKRSEKLLPGDIRLRTPKK